MRLNEVRPNGANVGCSTDEQQDDDDHAVETEESALNKHAFTITWRPNQINNNPFIVMRLELGH